MAGSFIKSVSLNEQMTTFLQDHPELSLTKIVQSKLLEIMEYQSKMRFYSDYKIPLQKAYQFIADKGLWEEFETWKSMKG